jgi:predicted PurR-regulated permease PerM
LPFYARATIILIGLIALLALLYIARGIIVPLVLALFSAIVLHPLVRFLVRRKIPRLLAIVVALFLAFIVIAALGALLYSQARQFVESWQSLVDGFTGVLNRTITWASGYLDINPVRIHDWIAKSKAELLNTSNAVVGQMLVAIGGEVVVLLLIPVYMFMFLFYHPLLIEFIHRIFGASNKTEVSEIITQVKTVIQQYLIGLVFEVVIMATLNTVALLILGIDYAILLGVLGALLNVIPYIGGIVSTALPVMIALATKPTAWHALYVLAVYTLLQLIDNNYIIPKIVASKVKINALVSIIVVIAGNALWGVPGMFLSIPLLAVIKLLFDHIEPLKPWGFLLGDIMPRLLRLAPILNRIRRRKQKAENDRSKIG